MTFTLDDILRDLEAKQIRLALEGDEILIKGRKSDIDPQLLALLRDSKQQLLAHLRDGDLHTPSALASNADSIQLGCEQIAPEMLPLLQISRDEIDLITTRCAGGASNIQDIYPLTPFQEGIHFHSVLAETADPYLQSFLIAMDTTETVDRYLSALGKVMDRHDILRTAFIWEGLSAPVQVVLRSAKLPVETMELDPDRDAVEDIYDRVQPQRRRMALDKAPLIHVFRAYDAGRERWLLLHLYHHLIGDHATMDMLHEEILAILQGVAGQLLQPLPFRSVVARSRAPIAVAASERFFTDMLHDLDETTAPFGRAQQQGDGSDMEETQIAIEPELDRRLRKAAQRAGTGLASLAHLAWALVTARATGRDDVTFGTVFFGRASGHEDGARIFGPLINTLPIRIRLAGRSVDAALRETHEALTGLLQHEHASLALAHGRSALPPRQPLFSSLLNYRYASRAATSLGIDGMVWIGANERTNYPFYISVDDMGSGCKLTVQAEPDIGAERICAMMQQALRSLADAMDHTADMPALLVEVLPQHERNLITDGFNPPAKPVRPVLMIHQEIAAQAARRPEATALAHGDTRVSYAELDAQANRLALRLQALDITPDDRVAICLERTPRVVIAILAVLKAGGAYIPLDPTYPQARLDFILQDAAVRVVVSDRSSAGLLASTPDIQVILIEDDEGLEFHNFIAAESGSADLRPEHLAYVIYTSGSTGNPKGVMVEHRALQSFCAAMDEQFKDDNHPRDWLALTSFSFDISILELLWPLRHGGCVTLGDLRRELPVAKRQPSRLRQFSLFFFAAEDAGTQDVPYRLLMEAARFADNRDFKAIWTPERHFHAFGGLYPNPSVIGSALAAITSKIDIRAGSVVLPLHDPLRVAEEWSVVDNLSGGRVSLSFAPGWNVDDFALRPEAYAVRHDRLHAGIETLRRLWRGEAMERINGAGETVAVRIHPRPVQSELKIWLTAGGNPETFSRAGRIGAHVLTHILGQDFATLAANIASYRKAYRDAGHPGEGHITLMIHTFVGASSSHALSTTRTPFRNYLEQSVDLMKAMSPALGFDPKNLNESDIEAISEHAFERYVGSNSLIGDARTCRDRLTQLDAIGVDEVACLIDFGVPFAATMEALERLDDLKNAWVSELDEPNGVHATLPDVQCTPSAAIALLDQIEADPSRPIFHRVLVGGEPLTSDIATRLQRHSTGGVYNMYGPTETTIWSTIQPCAGPIPGGVPIGRPLANNRVYILDAYGRPAPIGVTGEVHIGGSAVARGYLNRPHLTAERFCPDPFLSDPQARIYRTGDLGRWRPDGTIDFLGRTDYQVKIRGVRIELGEIEAQLTKHPDIREAVVMARMDKAENRRLVAYFVATSGADLLPEDLAADLAEHLPEYMHPAIYVQLDALPVTPNGKLDRAALPESDLILPGNTYEQPKGPKEELIAAIWEELLGHERISRHDNFFSLGGNSLLAISMFGKLRRHGFGTDIRSLFRTPTLWKLALTLDGAQASAIAANAIPVDCQRITPELLPLIELSQKDIDRVVATVPGGTANTKDIYGLSPLQEGILYHHLSSHKADPYVLGSLLAVPDRATADGFVKALEHVIARHDILRTAILWEGLSEPVQVVLRQVSLVVEEVELSTVHGDLAAQLSERFNPRHYRVDVREAPLVRLFLAHDQAHDRWLVRILHHHLGLDHAGLRLMLEEIVAYMGGRSDLLAAPVPFRNHIAAVRLGVGAAEHEAFFNEMLGDVNEPTLPYGMSDVQGDGRGLQETVLDLDEALSLRIRKQGRRLGVSAASLFHLAFGQVVGCLSGRDDVVFGTVLLGRLQGGEGAERALGMFINTLPLRVKLANVGVEAAVRATHATLSELVEHEHAPLAIAQRASRIASPHPLFSALLNYRHSVAGQEVELLAGDESVSGIQLLEAEERTNYPFNLSVNDLDTGFSLTAQVAAPADAAYVCTYMVTALQGLVDALEHDPLTFMTRLSILPDDQQALVLYGFNNTLEAYPSQALIHELFEAHAARAPDAIAVVCEDESLTYSELESQANRLAHHLIRLGVQPDDRVAICVERSLDMVVGLLAILKAGGAYVPLDTSYPSDRLAYTLQDSAPVAILTHGSAMAALKAAGSALDESGPPVVDIQDRAQWSERQATTPDARAAGLTSGNLAYVIYTSGSTGQPKGVMIEHRALVNQVEALRKQYDINASDRMLQFASFAFDMSVEEIFGTLGSGATLVLRTDHWLTDCEAFVSHCTRFGITLTNLPPSFLSLLIAADGSSLPATIRQVMIGGEAVDARTLRAWFKGSNPKLINAYGPTEATVNATLREVEPEDIDHQNVGRPIPNLRIYILDERMRPVPVGVAGRLWIGGIGLARGYLNQPELTAERFRPDPFLSDPQARIYDSGDLGRWMPDGTIAYLGRSDFQLKIRGFRIEPGEIEARLCDHSQVREAVVIAREDQPGDRRLAAYVVPAAGVAPEAKALRAHLAQTLPEHMVPAAYVVLDRLPLTPNGKLDRNALPAPDLGAFGTPTFEPPSGETEQKIAAIWQELLGVERVGRFDNFFNLGGNSLLAMRVIARLAQEHAVDLPLAEIFDRSVLAHLAEYLVTVGADQLPALEATERDGAVGLSFAQQRLWFLSQMEGVSEAYHIAAGLRLRGKLDRTALRRALDRIVERHEALRTRFSLHDDKPVQEIAPPGQGFALMEETLEHMSEEARHIALARNADAEARAPFDLARDPLARGRLIRLEADDHVLLVTLHHIVADGWSIGVLMQELATLYGAFAADLPDPLPPLAIQYADYSLWQHRHLDEARIEAQARYWQETLAGAPALLDLPSDRSRPAIQDHAGAALPITIDPNLAARLRALGRRHGTTLFMTLCAGFCALLARLSGQTDLVIGTPVANRLRREVEPLIGVFVNTLALRVNLADDPDMVELLARTRRTCLAAQAHQDLPFEQVVERLRPERSLSHAPLFQAMFTWQDGNDTALVLDGLEIELMDPERSTAKFDLTLDLAETEHGIAGTIEYATALFDRATIARYSDQLIRLLDAMTVDETMTLSALPLLSEAERTQVLYGFNDTAAPVPDGLCVHDLIARQAAASPQAVAVEDIDTRLTREMLHRQSDALAAHIQTFLPEPGARIAVALPRGASMLIALIAILKAGHAYVPLDPRQPKARLKTICDLAEVSAILAEETPFPTTLPLIRHCEAAVGVAPLPVPSDPERVAYIIFTSGSTGTPKGVAIPHRAVVNFLISMAREPGFGPQDTLLAVTTIMFDIAVLELFLPLVTGGRVVIAPADGVAQVALLIERLDRGDITVMQATPTLWDLLLDAGFTPRVGLTILAGGEHLQEDLAHRLTEGGATLWNMYGPTETTIWSALSLIEPGQRVTIGHPINNTELHILSEQDALQPIGAVGELNIGGAGLAIGYYNQPELTRRAFRDLTLEGRRRRLYRTGDLARRLPSGDIQLLGRKDAQVKLRGFRIELGEIEARLRAMPGVEKAAVDLREDSTGGRRLVAWLVGSEIDLAGIAARLATELPDYMHPKRWMMLDALPQTVNGKLDRASLPEPEAEARSKQFEVPEGEIEALVAGVWQDILGVEHVGRQDDFFELGGTSLLAIRLFTRLHHSIGIEIDIRNLFMRPNLAGFSEIVFEALLARVTDDEPATIIDA